MDEASTATLRAATDALGTISLNDSRQAYKDSLGRWGVIPTQAIAEAGEMPEIVASPDGWSIHRTGATDHEIAHGSAPPLASGPWMPQWWSPETQVVWRVTPQGEDRSIYVRRDDYAQFGKPRGATALLVTADLATGEEVPFRVLDRSAERDSQGLSIG